LIDEILHGLYTEVGDCGRDRFFNYVTRKFIGISRVRVQQFLNHQEVHQLTQPVRKNRVNRAIVMSKPMEQWQIDLIDMSKYKSPQNLNTTFVLTVVDCFSKMAFVELLRNKRADSVAAAMERIFERAGSAPRTIQSDNGGEFEEEFDQMLVRQGIDHSRSWSYNPQANGQIEQFNGTLKRMIHSQMLAGDTKTYVPRLQATVDTYNELLHTTIGHLPNDVHANADLWSSVAKRLQSKAMKSKKRGRKVPRPPLHIV
jgi:transposase InsO family protein